MLRHLLVGSLAVAFFSCAVLHAEEKAEIEARHLGQYRLTRRLGRGGMGEVYLAEHLLLQRACAVKVIAPAHATDEAVVRRFEREARTIAGLTHPNTVQVFDFGESDGMTWLVMELLGGKDLGAILAETPTLGFDFGRSRVART